MEKIVIEVSPKLAKVWRSLTPSRKRKLSKKVGKKLNSEVFINPTFSYLQYLDGLRNKMKERGLTQKFLDEILNEG